MLSATDPNSGEWIDAPEVSSGTAHIGIFDMFGLTPSTVPAKVDPQTGKAPTPTPAGVTSFLEQYSTAIFIGAAGLFFLAVMSRSRR